MSIERVDRASGVVWRVRWRDDAGRYGGLRPGEALALTWGHVRDRTLLIEAAVSLGELRDTKTGRRRTVALLARSRRT